MAHAGAAADTAAPALSASSGVSALAAQGRRGGAGADGSVPHLRRGFPARRRCAELRNDRLAGDCIMRIFQIRIRSNFFQNSNNQFCNFSVCIVPEFIRIPDICGILYTL